VGATHTHTVRGVNVQPRPALTSRLCSAAHGTLRATPDTTHHSFFQRSGLPKEVLARVWDLANSARTGAGGVGGGGRSYEQLCCPMPFEQAAALALASALTVPCSVLCCVPLLCACCSTNQHTNKPTNQATLTAHASTRRWSSSAWHSLGARSPSECWMISQSGDEAWGQPCRPLSVGAMARSCSMRAALTPAAGVFKPTPRANYDAALEAGIALPQLAGLDSLSGEGQPMLRCERKGCLLQAGSVHTQRTATRTCGPTDCLPPVPPHLQAADGAGQQQQPNGASASSSRRATGSGGSGPSSPRSTQGGGGGGASMPWEVPSQRVSVL
jgi:hypothetical protein